MRGTAGGKRLTLAATSTVTIAAFHVEQAAYFQEAGFDVEVVASASDVESFDGLGPRLSRRGVGWVALRMRREPSPFHDLRSLIAWIRYLGRKRPSVVVAGTPKAGLLAMAAATFVRVPTRILILHGLRSEGLFGFSRRVMRVMEKLSCTMATGVVCAGPSLADEAVRQGIASRQKATVLGAGSIAGVDVGYFRPPSSEERDNARSRLGLPSDKPVVGFVGRVAKDKGIGELTAAVRELKATGCDVQLLVAGEIEELDPPHADTLRELGSRWVSAVGFLEDVRVAYWAIDVLCIPSYREGLGTACLEAASCGLPVVTSSATGARDTVVDGVTGIIVEPREPDQVAAALLSLLSDAEIARGMGDAGRGRIQSTFSSSACNLRLLEYLSARTSIQIRSMDLP